MNALVWHGREDIRCDTATDSEIEHLLDASIRVISGAIRGSDMRRFRSLVHTNLPGDIMGCELMSVDVEAGRAAKNRLKKERVISRSTSQYSESARWRRSRWPCTAITGLAT